MPVVTPTTTVTNVPLGSYGNVVVSEERWPGLSIVTVTPPTITLAAGRWLLTTIISSLPAKNAAPAITKQSDTTLASPGNLTPASATFYHHRDFDAASTVNISVAVHLRSGVKWTPVAHGFVALTIPTAAAGVANTHYGSNVHLFIPSPGGDAVVLRKHLDNIVAAGMDTVITSTPFLYICPTSSTFSVGVASNVDTFYADCAARGLNVIATVDMRCTEIQAGWAGGTTANPWPTSDLVISNFVASYLSRWEPYAIHIVNEPNTTRAGPQSASRVMRVQNLAYGAGHVFTKVLVGGIASGDLNYLESLYQAGLAGKHDGVSIHPYHVRFNASFPLGEVGDPRQPWDRDTIMAEGLIDPWLEAVTEVYKVMTAHGEGALPVFVTEGGWSSAELSGNGVRHSPAEQSSNLAYGLRQLARCAFIDTVATYNSYDMSINRASWADNFGLARIDGTRKPAWTGVKDQITAIVGGTG